MLSSSSYEVKIQPIMLLARVTCQDDGEEMSVKEEYLQKE
jgi:hypothetical protein